MSLGLDTGRHGPRRESVPDLIHQGRGSILRTFAFEFLVASRYLKAKRKQAVIAVITTIAVLGIMAGVAVLLIALALVNGFNQDIRDKLLSGTAHLNLLRRDGEEISNYRELAEQMLKVPGVTAAAPIRYDNVLISGPHQAMGAILKGVDLGAPHQANEIWSTITEGRVEDLDPVIDPSGTTGPDGIILGRELADQLGVKRSEWVTLLSPEGYLTPFGLSPRQTRCRVVGIFHSGLYEYDSSWAYLALPVAQRLANSGDVAEIIQMKVGDIYAVKTIAKRVLAAAGSNYTTTDWQELNRPVFAALQIQRLVVVIVITLMILVAALNIITTLVMMAVEKTRDIAVLMAMGARSVSIMRVFMIQGLLVGLIGTLVGLGLGAGACWAADHYHLVRLPESVFSISYAPFKLRSLDVLVVSLISLTISFLATIYPSRSAARLDPVEGVRYE